MANENLNGNDILKGVVLALDGMSAKYRITLPSKKVITNYEKRKVANRKYSPGPAQKYCMPFLEKSLAAGSSVDVPLGEFSQSGIYNAIQRIAKHYDLNYYAAWNPQKNVYMVSVEYKKSQGELTLGDGHAAG